MVKIRLKRLGRRHEATYRIVVADSRSPRDGKFIAELGFYNPNTKEIKIDRELKDHWIKLGAKPSATINSLLKKYDAKKGEVKKGSVIKLKIKTKVRKPKNKEVAKAS